MRSALLPSCVVALLLAAGGCGTHAPVPDRTNAAREIDRLPLVVAHRGGTADYPENTQLAIRESVRHQANMIWLTVQLSRDGVPVLYRPADLSANTQGTGPVSALTLAQLQRLNAGWHFARAASNGTVAFPYRSQPLPVPSLARALAAIPPSVGIVLDMKALPATPQAQAVARVLDEADAWNRVLIYSTDNAYQQAFAGFPRARLFESRDGTRARLAAVALAGTCTSAPEPGTWSAFEYRRKVQLLETITLGEARSTVDAALWSPPALACFRSKGKAPVLAIGINNADDYVEAACLGIDAVMTDSLRTMQAIRSQLTLPLRCYGPTR